MRQARRNFDLANTLLRPFSRAAARRTLAPPPRRSCSVHDRSDTVRVHLVIGATLNDWLGGQLNAAAQSAATRWRKEAAGNGFTAPAA